MGLQLSIVAKNGIKPLVLLSPPSAGSACMRLHIRGHSTLAGTNCVSGESLRLGGGGT